MLVRTAFEELGRALTMDSLEDRSCKNSGSSGFATVAVVASRCAGGGVGLTFAAELEDLILWVAGARPAVDVGERGLFHGTIRVFAMDGHKSDVAAAMLFKAQRESMGQLRVPSDKYEEQDLKLTGSPLAWKAIAGVVVTTLFQHQKKKKKMRNAVARGKMMQPEPKE